MPQQRSHTPEPPYSWQSKAALRRIRQYMEERDQWSLVASRLCVYQALCEMASNHESRKREFFPLLSHTKKETRCCFGCWSFFCRPVSGNAPG
jgi:hypothetical protein